jgi:hypothetical protein
LGVNVPKFDYDSLARVPGELGGGKGAYRKAWVVGVFEERKEVYFDRFPPGTVYTVEFEDGSSMEIHEDDLEPWA